MSLLNIFAELIRDNLVFQLVRIRKSRHFYQNATFGWFRTLTKNISNSNPGRKFPKIPLTSLKCAEIRDFWPNVSHGEGGLIKSRTNRRKVWKWFNMVKTRSSVKHFLAQPASLSGRVNSNFWGLNYVITSYTYFIIII